MDRRILVAVLVGGTALAGSARGADQDGSETVRLVRQLGDSSFAVRERAAQTLRDRGPAGLPALHAAAESGDLETRYRARRLIDEIEQADHERRLDEFLAHPDQTQDDLLPGWQTFRTIAGDEEAARELFVGLQRAEPRLFRRLEKDAETLAAEYEQRVIELQYAYARRDDRGGLVPHVAALLLIGAESQIEISARIGSALYSFLNYNEFRSAFSDGAKGQALRGLLGHWIAQPGGASDALKVNLALQQNLPEGLVPALQTVRGNAADSHLQFAILTIGRFGDEDQIPALEPLLHNETVLTVTRSKTRVTYTCQVRDVALAVLLHLTGQDTRSYGFSRLSRNPQYLYSPTSMGFATEAQRQAALARWHEWQRTAPVKAPRPE